MKLSTKHVGAFLSVVFFMSNLSYLPFFTEGGITHLITYPLWILLIAVLLLSTKGTVRYVASQKILFLTLLSFFILITIYQTITGRNYYSSELTRCLMIAALVFLIGMMTSQLGCVAEKEDKLFVWFICSTVIVDIVVYTQYLRGYDITSMLYAYSSKNELAFLNITGIVILLYTPALREKRKLLNLVCLTIMTVSIALMRCRSMLIAAVVIYFVYLFVKSSSKWIKSIIVMVAIALSIALLNDKIYKIIVDGIIFAGRNATSLDDVSSGRLTIIKNALVKYSNHIFAGTGDTSTVDCFPVSALMQYGTIAGAILMVLACYPVGWCLKRMKNGDYLIIVLLFIGIAYLIGSLFEENAPFGPGVRCYMLWFLFGYLSSRFVGNVKNRGIENAKN